MKKLLLLFFMLNIAQSVTAEKLYVFVPSTSSPKAIKESLEKVVTAEILTFSQLGDFVKQVQADKPEGVITREGVLTTIPGYTVKLEGVYKGNSSQDVYAITTKDGFTPDASSKLGVVDFLGKDMNTVTTETVGADAKIKKVKKFKDLLPLLTMNMVDAVIIAESEVSDLKKSSSQDLKEVKMAKPIAGYVVFGATGTSKTAEELKKLSKDANLSMGVESWK